MRTVFRLSWSAGIVVAISLALGLPQAGAIVGGWHDGNDHPNVGIVYNRYVPATYGFCSGTLISEDEFLTAGHCTELLDAYGLDPSWLAVSIDEELTLSPEWVISTDNPIGVTGWTTHPGFRGSSGTSLVNDVGVIHLAQAVSLTPIDLPEVGFLDTQAARGKLRNHAFVDVGYGLNGITMPSTVSWEHRRMATASPFMGLTLDRLFQSGGICAGDSGGPAFWGSGSNLQVGTTSAADHVCGSLATFQRLDTQSVRDFLDLYR